MKKIMIFVLVAVGSLLDKVIPAANNAIRAAICMFYIANEGLSILENAGALGLPLPAVLKKWLAKLKEVGEDETPIK
jgi:toxin secretion/phage lysis holin